MISKQLNLNHSKKSYLLTIFQPMERFFWYHFQNLWQMMCSVWQIRRQLCPFSRKPASFCVNFEKKRSECLLNRCQRCVRVFWRLFHCAATHFDVSVLYIDAIDITDAEKSIQILWFIKFWFILNENPILNKFLGKIFEGNNFQMDLG